MEIEKLTFLAVALCQSESGNCGLCLAVIREIGALPWVGTWQGENLLS